MPTRGVIRSEVRHNLGEFVEGTWTDATLNYFIEEACTEHSQRAYSNKVVRFASSIRYVQNYRFPPDFGELCSIRYYDEDGGDRELDYVTRAVIRDLGFRGTELGRACAFFREQDSFGLFPIPEKKIMFEYTFEGDCPNFTPILDRSVTPLEPYRNDMELQIVAEDEVVDRDGLDPSCVYIGQVGVFLRRKGRSFPGEILMSFQGLPLEDHYVQESGKVYADVIAPRPDWHYFDFANNAIEVSENVQSYAMRLYGDSEYQDANPAEYGGIGVEIGTDPETGNNTPYFQLHRLRQDIEIEYYRNKVDPLLNDDQELEIPQRYHHTIVKMVVSKAYAQGNYNLPASREWKADADDDIKLAKTQAIIPTLGRRLEIRDSARLNANLQYKGDGKFTLRFGNILG